MDWRSFDHLCHGIDGANGVAFTLRLEMYPESPATERWSGQINQPLQNAYKHIEDGVGEDDVRSSGLPAAGRRWKTLGEDLGENLNFLPPNGN